MLINFSKITETGASNEALLLALKYFEMKVGHWVGATGSLVASFKRSHRYEPICIVVILRVFSVPDSLLKNVDG